MMNVKKFIQKFLKKFPQYRVLILDNDFNELPHLQMRQISNILNDAIKANDDNTVNSIFLFINDILEMLNAESTNTLAVSCLEHLDFEDRQNYLFSMPSKLQKLYNEIIEYNKSIKHDNELQDLMKKIIDESGLF